MTNRNFIDLTWLYIIDKQLRHSVLYKAGLFVACFVTAMSIPFSSLSLKQMPDIFCPNFFNVLMSIIFKFHPYVKFSKASFSKSVGN